MDDRAKNNEGRRAGRRRTLRLAAGIALILAVASAAGVVAIRRARPPEPRPKLNILVVSLCSLRYQEIPAFQPGATPVSPEMNKFIEQSSFVFDNLFNGMSWLGIFAFTRQMIPENFVPRVGYDLIGSNERGHLQRVPESRYGRNLANKLALMNYYEKDIAASTQTLKKLILSPHPRPFFVVAHYKYLHYPLIDRFNPDSQWYRYLTTAQRARVGEYLDHPSRFPNKLPLLLMLTYDAKVAAGNRLLTGKLGKLGKGPDSRLLGLVNNPELLARWRKDPDFNGDVAILNAVYRSNLHYIDSQLAGILNLYGDESLRKNTLVVLTGDHGEMHMERGQLTHSTTVYDEALKVPMAIRFPDSDGGEPRHITRQMDFLMFPEIFEKIMTGEVGADNFDAYVNAMKRDVFLARDCANRVRGLRYKNEYKYFVRVSDGRRFLFDLRKDPAELVNIADAEPAVAARMEELYWRHFRQFSDEDVYGCAKFD